MDSYDNTRDVLNSPFDVDTHKRTFINYLEVVILEDGTIEYAVPSHMLKVTDIIANARHITRKGVADLCPVEYYADYSNWLCKQSRAIMVWNNFYMGEPNDNQLKALIMLMKEGLYIGNIDVDRFERNNLYSKRFGKI